MPPETPPCAGTGNNSTIDTRGAIGINYAQHLKVANIQPAHSIRRQWMSRGSSGQVVCLAES